MGKGVEKIPPRTLLIITMTTSNHYYYLHCLDTAKKKEKKNNSHKQKKRPRNEKNRLMIPKWTPEHKDHEERSRSKILLAKAFASYPEMKEILIEPEECSLL